METKRITRSRTDRMIAGVAGGLAAYFGIDPLFVRLAFVFLALLNGIGVILYFALWLIVPNEGSLVEGRSNLQESVAEMQVMLEELMNRVRGVFSR